MLFCKCFRYHNRSRTFVDSQVGQVSFAGGAAGQPQLAPKLRAGLLQEVKVQARAALLCVERVQP